MHLLSVYKPDWKIKSHSPLYTVVLKLSRQEMSTGNIYFGVFLIVTVFTVAAIGAPQSNQLASQYAGAAANGGQVGKPQFHLNGAGSGNNGRNWGAHGNVGVGVKAWESQNGRHAVGVGANYGQSAGRFQGQSWKSRPDIGVGAGYSYTFGGGRRG